jgi:hypothetical protein
MDAFLLIITIIITIVLLYVNLYVFAIYIHPSDKELHTNILAKVLVVSMFLFSKHNIYYTGYWSHTRLGTNLHGSA